MTLRNDDERANTQRKLEDLEKLIERAKNNAGPGRPAEVRSLSRLAQELREEIMRYDAASRVA